jgi:hypothetical protein
MGIKITDLDGKQYDMYFNHNISTYKLGQYRKGTECIIASPLLRQKVLSAKSAMNPVDKNYSKRIGRKVSFGKVVSKMFPSDKKQRANMWKQYFKCIPGDK